VFFTLDVDIVTIAIVIALAAASHVDETMHRLTLVKSFADVALGFFYGNLGINDQFDVEILGIVDFFLCHNLHLLMQK
jgi:hypothetical protein